jgi:hypothetical protein
VLLYSTPPKLSIDIKFSENGVADLFLQILQVAAIFKSN